MKVLVIGFGSIGKRHVDILSVFESVQQIDLVTRQKLSQYVTFPSLSSVSDLNSYDYFVISSETSCHFEQLKYLEKKVSNKLLLVEKPVFSQKKIINICKNQVFVAYNLRFHPIIQQIRNWIKGKQVLSVNIVVGQYLPEWRPDRDYRRCYSANKERGGGVLLDLSHEIDYVQWLFGDIISFEAINERISELEITSDDYFSLIGKTARGTYVTLNMDYINRIPCRQILINTSNSSIKTDLFSGYLYQKTDKKELEEITFSNLDRNTSFINMHKSLLSSSYEDICTLKEGLSILAIIKDIQ